MEQRSPEWFAARIGLVTGSAVGSILGLSPYSNRDDVMRRMVREALGAESEQEENIAMSWGANNEAGALIEFQMETGLKVDPAYFVKHSDGWLGASPDGYIGDDALIEIKAPFGLRKAEAPVSFKTLEEQPHYAAQIMVQLHCTDRKRCAFYQWAPAGTKLEWVDRDDDWLNENIPRLKQFWAEYCDVVAGKELSAEHLAPRRVVVDTPEASRALREWDELKEQADLISERQKDLLANITAMAKGKDALIAGRKVTLVEKAGSVRYAAVVKEKLKGLDLTPWTGAKSTYWKIT